MAHDTTVPSPLSLDRVIGDEPITSSLPIFQLPVELINHVTPYLSSLDIENLSLVDRDTNQLARALQFVYVKLDYSDRALDILARLREEVDSLKYMSRRIGTCIRRLTVSSIRHHSRTRKGIDVDGLHELSIQDRFRCTEPKQTETQYLHSICELLPHLPNLHILDWNDEGPLTPDMMKLIMSSSIAHLRLNGPVFDSPFPLPRPASGTSWPLETLFLNTGSSEAAPTPGSVIPGLLRLTAPTLRQLVWCGNADRLSWPCPSYEDIRFPVLRDVVLHQVRFRDPSLLHRIFDERSLIRSLSVDSSSITPQFLARHGRIPSLASLRWNSSYSDSHDDMVKFMHANHQLFCLEIAVPLSSASIDSILIQHDRLHFDYLVALHLVSEDRNFPREALKTIALAKSLKHLWLSAGAQWGLRHEWEIDHECVMDVLKPLFRLETIAFTRDSYRVNGHILLDASIERYYMNKVLPSDLLLHNYLTEEELMKANTSHVTFDHSLRLRDSLFSLAWERWHQSQMVMYATEYSKVFRELKWRFMGQLPMRVEENVFWRIAELDACERDPSLDALRAHWDRVLKSL